MKVASATFLYVKKADYKAGFLLNIYIWLFVCF